MPVDSSKQTGITNTPNRQRCRKEPANTQCQAIIYHCRMRYLRSRQGGTRDRSRLVDEKGKVPLSRNSDKPLSTPRSRSARTSFAVEHLLPPTELMTREKAFRYIYNKHHPLTTPIRKIVFLKKKVDPITEKKREEIFARIKASERMKQNEPWKKSEQRVTWDIIPSDATKPSVLKYVDSATREKPEESFQAEEETNANISLIRELKDNTANVVASFSTLKLDNSYQNPDFRSVDDSAANLHTPDFTLLSDWRRNEKKPC